MKFEPFTYQKQTEGLKFDTLGGSRYIDAFCVSSSYVTLQIQTTYLNCSIATLSIIHLQLHFNMSSFDSTADCEPHLLICWYFSTYITCINWICLDIFSLDVLIPRHMVFHGFSMVFHGFPFICHVFPCFVPCLLQKHLQIRPPKKKQPQTEPILQAVPRKSR